MIAQNERDGRCSIFYYAMGLPNKTANALGRAAILYAGAERPEKVAELNAQAATLLTTYSLPPPEEQIMKEEDGYWADQACRKARNEESRLFARGAVRSVTKWDDNFHHCFSLAEPHEREAIRRDLALHVHPDKNAGSKEYEQIFKVLEQVDSHITDPDRLAKIFAHMK